MKSIRLLATIFVLLTPIHGFGAQEQTEKKDGDVVSKDEKKKPDHEHQTYLKVGLGCVETTIEGFGINVKGMTFDIETHFNKNHMGLSGWFVGYRKDDLTDSDSGHLLNFGAFRKIDMPAVALKMSGGAEWGIPTVDFSGTRFNYENGNPVSYEHLFLKHNSGIPGIGTSKDAVFYPFIELSLLKKWRWLLAEGGIRGNIQKFGFDKYHLGSDDLIFVSRDRIRLLPTFFVKAGIDIGRRRDRPKGDDSENMRK